MQTDRRTSREAIQLSPNYNLKVASVFVEHQLPLSQLFYNFQGTRASKLMLASSSMSSAECGLQLSYARSFHCSGYFSWLYCYVVSLGNISAISLQFFFSRKICDVIWYSFTLPYCMYIVGCVCFVHRHYLNRLIIPFSCTVYFSTIVLHVCLGFFTFSTLIPSSVPPAN